MSRSRLGTWVLVLTMTLAASFAAVPTQQVQAATATSRLSVWQVTPTPNPVPPAPALSNVSFRGVSASGAGDAWAVGSKQTISQQPLAEHWNGTAWKPVSVAQPTGGGATFLTGVDDLSPSDVWAVGETQDARGDPLTLVEHWTGAAWSIVPSPNPEVGPGTADVLNAIAGVGPNDLWAIGWYSDGVSFTNLLFEHWNDTVWSFVPPPAPQGFDFGEAVTAIASNDVWAVGNIADGEATLAEHWNGQAWSIVPTPNLRDGLAPQNFLTGVSTVASNNVWASGYEGNVDQMNFSKPYLLHWDGTMWKLVLVPNAGTEGSLLFGTTALSPSNIVAVGQTQESDGAILTLSEHFNGSTWNIVPSPDPGQVGPAPDNTLDATASTSGGSVWAVGTQEIPGQCCLRTLAMGISRAGSATQATTGSSAGANAWGDNSAGELGNGTAVQSDLPGAVSGLSEIQSLSAGGRHNLALLTNGTVMAWGDNTFGQLGDGLPGPNNDSGVPVAVQSLSGVTAVSSGGEHSLALLSNGTVMAWGQNSSGQLGNGTTIDSDVPVAVKRLTGVVAISAGYLHSLAVLANGTVMAWGSNGNGQLGDGTDSNISDVPVAVKGLSGVMTVAAGGQHSLALLKNGTVMAWGENDSGQLGDGTFNGSDLPVAVKGLSGVMSISAGSEHSMALLTDGTVVAWGSNSFYQLGQNNNFPGGIGQSDVPVLVKGLSGVTAISAGGLFNLALLSNGTVMDWGDNATGQLGNGTTNDIIMPAPLPGLSAVTAVSAGDVHSLAGTAAP